MVFKSQLKSMVQWQPIKKLFIFLLCLLPISVFADTVTYYFNGYSAGEVWDTSPANMVDGDIGTYASATPFLTDTQLLNTNTCDGTGLGRITKVELRVYGYKELGGVGINIRPVFSGGDGNEYDTNMTTSAGWSSYIDITLSANAPQDWLWGNIQNLDCDVEANGALELTTLYCSKVEVRVTYAKRGLDVNGATLNNITIRN